MKRQGREHLTGVVHLVELPQRRDLVHRKMKKKPTEVPHHKQNECVANRQQPPRGGQGFRRADGSVQRDRQAGGDPPCSAHHRQQSRHRQEAAGQKQLKVEDRGPVTPQMEPQGGFPSALGPLKAVVQNGNDGCEREERPAGMPWFNTWTASLQVGGVASWLGPSVPWAFRSPHAPFPPSQLGVLG